MVTVILPFLEDTDPDTLERIVRALQSRVEGTATIVGVTGTTLTQAVVIADD